MGETNKPIEIVFSTPALRVQNKPEKKEHKQRMDALLLAYMMIFESVLTKHRTAQIQAKQVENQVQSEDVLIREENQQNFLQLTWSQLFKRLHLDKRNAWSIWMDLVNSKNSLYFLPSAQKEEVMKDCFRIMNHHGKTFKLTVNKKVGTTLLAAINISNLEISAVRNNLEDQLTVLRQIIQIGDTDLNSTINEDQQSVQEGASLMQMLVSLSNQISKI